MRRPEKKEYEEPNIFDRVNPREGAWRWRNNKKVGFNECHDLDTPYIEHLENLLSDADHNVQQWKKYAEILRKKKKPSVEEIENIIKYQELTSQAENSASIKEVKIMIKDLAQAIDKLNKEE